MGAKRIPMMNSVGSTVRGVRIGCHAFSRCCLNAVSAEQSDILCHTLRTDGRTPRDDSLAGLRQLPFSFFGVPLPSSPPFLRLKRPMERCGRPGHAVLRV